MILLVLMDLSQIFVSSLQFLDNMPLSTVVNVILILQRKSCIVLVETFIIVEKILEVNIYFLSVCFYSSNINRECDIYQKKIKKKRKNQKLFIKIRPGDLVMPDPFGQFSR